MCWNDGYERRKFEARQKKQAEEYRALGMTEEQIKEMYPQGKGNCHDRRRMRRQSYVHGGKARERRNQNAVLLLRVQR